MPLSFYDRQHIQKMLVQEQTIAGIFNMFISKVSPQLKKWADTGKTNVWVRNAIVEKTVERELLTLHSELAALITDSQVDAFKRANLKNDKLVEEYIKGMSISETLKKGLFAQNIDILKEFQSRKEGGMNLSQKVWNLAEQTKTQLEFYLESGLSVGRSAAAIGQDIRQILKEPDKRFHRIKDAKGNLVLSKPMKNYHPGKGQYRSSAMNARRVAVTETNMMYRKADSARWAKMDFVTGIHVQRSSTKNDPCKICDPLSGDYPKAFVYLGWHPFCVCPATPILLAPEEFAEYLHTDQIPVNKIITDIPEGMKQYISVAKADNPPLWFRDNFKDGKFIFQTGQPDSTIPKVKEKEQSQEARAKEIFLQNIDSVSERLKNLGNWDLLPGNPIGESLRATPQGKEIIELIRKGNKDIPQNLIASVLENVRVENGYIRLDYLQLNSLNVRVKLTEEERKLIWGHSGGGYIRTSNSMKINGCLNDISGMGKNKTIGKVISDKGLDIYGFRLSEDDIKNTIPALDKVIVGHKAEFNMTVVRKIDEDGLRLFGINARNDSLKSIVKKIEEKAINGDIFVNYGYTSTSGLPDLNVFGHRKYTVEYNLPQGTNLYVTDDFDESEIILGRGLKIRVTKVEVLDEHSGELKLFVDVIP